MSQIASPLETDEAVSAQSVSPTSQVRGPVTGERVTISTAAIFSVQSLFSAAMALVIAVYMSKFYGDVVLIPAAIVALIIAGGRAQPPRRELILRHLAAIE